MMSCEGVEKTTIDLLEYEVPIDWLKEHVNNIDEFIDEYTADETTGLYETAQRDGVILNEHWVED